MATDLRQFRRAVAVLKKQGLITGTLSNGRSVDARSAYPSWKVKGKTLETIVRKYDDVVSGKATAVSITPKELKAFRKSTHYESANGKLIVPHSAAEKVIKQKGEIVIQNVSGIDRVLVPVEGQNIRSFLLKLRRDKNKINAMKKRNESFGFRYRRNKSIDVYGNIEQAIARLMEYETIDSDVEGEDEASLEFVRIRNLSTWFRSDRKKMSSEYNRDRSRRYRKNLKNMPQHVQDATADASAARQREYRKRMKGNAAVKYKKAAKVRAKKSRDKKRKGKKKR